MTFDEAYSWILSLSNMPRKEYMNNPRTCAWYLERLQAFLDILGNPEKKINHYVHVTGTSGKGSTTAFMHSILHDSGIKVGSTYSPHPTTIIERWKIGERYMTEKEFVSIIEYLKPKLNQYIQKTKYDMISFFELTEAIGLVFFVQNKVTHVVMEVACGGRYDSSNIIPHKDVAIITNIGLDHVGIIGNNKSEIAYEKAGIITKQTGRAITGERNNRIAKIIEHEASIHQIPYQRISTPAYSDLSITKHGTTFTYQENTYTLPVFGKHQIHNAILCIEAAKQLEVKTTHIQKGLATAPQPLRMEIIKEKPLTILDGAHNEDKVKSTVFATQTLKPLYNFKHVRLIIGFSGDKNVESMLRHLLSLTPASVAITRNTVNPFRKVADMHRIRLMIKKYLPKCRVELFLDPEDAYRYTIGISKSTDCILATGSIFMAGELRGKVL